MRKRLTDAVILIAGVIALTAIAYWNQQTVRTLQSSPSTYDYGGRGYAALYSFLKREHIEASRFEEPLDRLAPHGSTLVIAADASQMFIGVPRADADSIGSWVRGGGTLVILGAPNDRLAAALALPRLRAVQMARGVSACGVRGRFAIEAAFASAFAPGSCRASRKTLLQHRAAVLGIASRLGKGIVVAIASETIFDNLHIGHAQNAGFAYALFSALPPPQFDEDLYGHERAHSFWGVLPQPVRAAIIVLLAVVLLAVAGANLPFAPPHRLQPAGERHTGEYIDSLAKMLQRGATRAEIIGIICAQASDAIGARPADPGVRAVKEELDALSSQRNPNDQDVLAAGRLFVHLRKEFQL